MIILVSTPNHLHLHLHLVSLFLLPPRPLPPSKPLPPHAFNHLYNLYHRLIYFLHVNHAF
eukprot:UN10342